MVRRLFLIILLLSVFASGCIDSGKSQGEIDLEREKLALEREKIMLEKMRLEKTPPPTTAQPQTTLPPTTLPPETTLPPSTTVPPVAKDDSSVDSETLKLLDTARRKVVVVGGGTGFFIRPNGYIITNEHVVSGFGEGSIPESLPVTTFEGDQFTASVISTDEGHDIAILKIDADYPHFEFGSSSDLVAGDTLYVIGHPGTIGYWIVAKGEFLRTEETTHIGDVLTEWIMGTDIFRGGNSGSPVLNSELKVVGVGEGSAAVGQPPQEPQEIEVIENISDHELVMESNAVASDLVSRLVDEVLGPTP